MTQLRSGEASSVSAEVLEFRKVDYFVVVTEDGEEPKEQKFDARLEIDQDAKQLKIVHEKGGAAKATDAEIPFGDVTSVLYERSKSPRVRSVGARALGNTTRLSTSTLLLKK